MVRRLLWVHQHRSTRQLCLRAPSRQSWQRGPLRTDQPRQSRSLTTHVFTDALAQSAGDFFIPNGSFVHRPAVLQDLRSFIRVRTPWVLSVVVHSHRRLCPALRLTSGGGTTDEHDPCTRCNRSTDRNPGVVFQDSHERLLATSVFLHVWPSKHPDLA